MNIVEMGPLRVALTYSYRLSPRSTLQLRVSLTALSPTLEFQAEVLWNEDHKFLKVEFPLKIRAMNASYEIPFGYLERPTHFNTSWDIAKFEVCAQRWADLYEPGFGVAILNDCKYGYATHSNVLRLSLLRSPKNPDEEADMGRHIFRYAIYPHDAPLPKSGVLEEALRFNFPLISGIHSALTKSDSFFSIEEGTLIIDTVKLAEDSNSIVIRFYEPFGSRGNATFVSKFALRQVVLCNLLEEDDSFPLPVIPHAENGGAVRIEYSPFQIITVKITIK